MNEKDRRVKRTKKLLKDSLAELLLEKNIHSITVRELTDRADISRGAFYTHYDDIFDIFDQLQRDLLNEISELMKEDPTHTYYETFNKLLDYVKDNASICMVFMCKGSDGYFRDQLMNLLEANIMKIVLYEMEASESTENWTYLVRYNAAGLIAVLSLWLESGFKYSKESLYKLILDIDDRLDCLY